MMSFFNNVSDVQSLFLFPLFLDKTNLIFPFYFHQSFFLSAAPSYTPREPFRSTDVHNTSAVSGEQSCMSSLIQKLTFFKLKEGRFRLDGRESFSLRVVRCSNRLPRKAVECLEVLKASRMGPWAT